MMATYGLLDLHYAIIESEDSSGTTYGEVKPIAPAMNVGITRTVNRANLRGDNAVRYTAASKGPATITLGTTELPKQVEADLLGKTIAPNGLLVEGDDDKPPYVAIGFRADDARGGYLYVWLYRVQFSVGESTYETKQETPAYQAPVLTGESIPRLDNGKREAALWDGDPDVTDSTIFDEWFTTVVDENWAPSV